MKPIRVLIVEDSPVVGEHLRRIISADPKFEVVAIATSGEEALSLVARLTPDVISMDVQLPGIQGLEATRRIMEQYPTPIVVVSGVQSYEVSLTMQALQAGALAVVEKPVAVTHENYAALSGRLRTQLAIMSEIKVVRQRAPLPGRTRAANSLSDAPGGSYHVLAIAASTGGPSALMHVLRGLGAGFPLPIVVAQHMNPTFLRGFANWLESVVPLPVSIVHELTTLAPGRVYLAPCDERHLVVRGLSALPSSENSLNSRHYPSANVLFSSMAQSLGSHAIGVLLTGMGEDGAIGLGELKRAGSYTIAEDESTAVVFGMPGAAARLGSAHQVLPLKDIAPRLLTLTAAKPEVV